MKKLNLVLITLVLLMYGREVLAAHPRVIYGMPLCFGAYQDPLGAASLPDMNGDGVREITILSAGIDPSDPTGTRNGTMIQVYSGADGKELPSFWSDVEQPTQVLQHLIYAVGDVDGDGVQDTAVHHELDDGFGSRATIFSGRRGAEIYHLDSPEYHQGLLNTQINVGDVNFDDFADFAIVRYDPSGPYCPMALSVTSLCRHEVEGDQIDNDCDGQVDEAPLQSFPLEITCGTASSTHGSWGWALLVLLVPALFALRHRFR